MRLFIGTCVLVLTALVGVAQTTVTSGNWSDPTVWAGGTVPAAGGTVTVSNPLTIDTDLSPTGTWTFGSNTTDQPGGTVYFFNPTDGTNTLTVSAGVTVTFEGGGANQATNGANCGGCNQFNSGTINIYGTLILASTILNNSGNLNVNIEAGGTLIINGDLVNKNNSGTFTVTGALIVNGTFDCATGSVTVGGSGTIDTTGPLLSNGGSTIFGSPNDCTTGPCSGSTLSCTFTNTISPTSKVKCSGSTAGTLTGTTNGTSPTYQWLSSTDGVTYANASGTSTNSTYVTPALSQTTWYRLQVTASSCTSTSAATKITIVPASGGWIGITSNDWSVGSNWCSTTAPTSATDVVIANAATITNMPNILSGTAALCKSLTISNTTPVGSVIIQAAPDASLSISGDFTNNGTFKDNSTAATAGVMFVGGVPQTIAGSTATVFNNLTIANTSGATPAITITSNNVTAKSSLTLTSGTINLNGNTIVLGTAAGSTGVLSRASGYFYAGNIQRWFPTSTVAVNSAASAFPIGSSTDYRPIYFGNAGLATGGTIKVSHTAVNGPTPYGAPFSDAAGTGGTASPPNNVILHSNSYWSVTTANGLGAGTYGISTEGTGFGTVAAVGDLRVTLLSGVAPGSDGSHSGTTSNPQVNRTGLTLANLSNSFYWGSVAAATSLPITLVSFAGENLNGAVMLNWSTASELNNDYFTILHSVNGEKFNSIGDVKGNGTTRSPNTYSLIDRKPDLGKNYYQLKQTDLDGHSTVSETIVVDVLSVDPLMSIFPNPLSQNQLLNVVINGLPASSPTEIQILNMQGIKVNGHTIDTDSDGLLKTSIALTGLSSGLYILKVQNVRYKFILE